MSGGTRGTTMSKFAVIDDTEEEGEPAQPSITAFNHPGGKAGEARPIPCNACVRRLTSDSENQYLPCLEHLSRRATKCFQCSSSRKMCYELPPGAVNFGREFQDATIRRFGGQTVDDWEVLGEKTMQAINEANERPVKRTRRAVDAPDIGAESSVEYEASDCGKLQADSEQQQPSVQPPLQQPQPHCQEEPLQPDGDLQPPVQGMASRQDLQNLRAQILHDVRQVLGQSHLRECQGESLARGCAPPAPPAVDLLSEINGLNETVQGVMAAAQRSREGVATIVIHFR